MSTEIPNSPDGLATNPQGQYQRVASDYTIRVTPEGWYRITADMPSDFSITNDGAELPPPNNYLICDRTGFKVSVEEGLKEEWTGAMVRKESWEPRHPQEMIRTKPEHSTPSPRPEQEDIDVADRYPNGVSVSDLG